MKFRPCIDIHNGTVKQIVGGSLTDRDDRACENFSSDHNAAWFARMYREDSLRGGHVIMLNSPSSDYYEKTRAQALSALCAYPGGMQIGGGIGVENAKEYIDAGASHVIVTSYVFSGGIIRWDHLENLCDAVGAARIVLDLSCRKKDGKYVVVTDRWQNMTKEEVTETLLEKLALYCDEFLIHGVDVEGKKSGFDQELVRLLSNYEGRPVTYAGGIDSMRTLYEFEKISGGRLDITVGSALDIFGGSLPYKELAKFGG